MFKEFGAEFTREVNRMRIERGTDLESKRHELGCAAISPASCGLRPTRKTPASCRRPGFWMTRCRKNRWLRGQDLNL
ncbi:MULTISPECIES: hypothetical protein [Methylobacterium]|uniref:hypothetical protein n=1 Tax=Methylobacterium TaxID=407 RepID=UPI002F359DE7